MVNKDVQEILGHIEAQDGVVARMKNHYLVKAPNGKQISVPNTPSDYRAIKNVKAQLKRAGFVFPDKRAQKKVAISMHGKHKSIAQPYDKAEVLANFQPTQTMDAKWLPSMPKRAAILGMAATLDVVTVRGILRELAKHGISTSPNPINGTLYNYGYRPTDVLQKTGAGFVYRWEQCEAPTLGVELVAPRQFPDLSVHVSVDEVDPEPTEVATLTRIEEEVGTPESQTDDTDWFEVAAGLEQKLGDALDQLREYKNLNDAGDATIQRLEAALADATDKYNVQFEAIDRLEAERQRLLDLVEEKQDEINSLNIERVQQAARISDDGWWDVHEQFDAETLAPLGLEYRTQIRRKVQ